jgi:hypothetical protein
MPAEAGIAGPIRVFLVDDHRIVRSGVSAYLAQVAQTQELPYQRSLRVLEAWAARSPSPRRRRQPDDPPLQHIAFPARVKVAGDGSRTVVPHCQCRDWCARRP